MSWPGAGRAERGGGTQSRPVGLWVWGARGAGRHSPEAGPEGTPRAPPRAPPRGGLRPLPPGLRSGAALGPGR